MVWRKHKRRKAETNPDIYHTLNRVAIWWEDAVSHDTWKDIDEARKDSLAVCFSEGYLIQEDKEKHILCMSISEKDVGDEMIIPTKNILRKKRIGKKIFWKKDFEYKNYKGKKAHG